jgi:hypothetical protein
LVSQINKDVAEISALMIETSLLVNFYYYQLLESGFDLSGSEKPNFLNFFYQLVNLMNLEQQNYVQIALKFV